MKLEFPRFVVKAVYGYPFYKLTHNESEYNESLKSGWFGYYDEAMAQREEVKSEGRNELKEEDNATPTREEIEAKCTELGIAFDGRMKDATLLKKIEEALYGKAE